MDESIFLVNNPVERTRSPPLCRGLLKRKSHFFFQTESSESAELAVGTKGHFLTSDRHPHTRGKAAAPTPQSRAWTTMYKRILAMYYLFNITAADYSATDALREFMRNRGGTLEI